MHAPCRNDGLPFSGGVGMVHSTAAPRALAHPNPGRETSVRKKHLRTAAKRRRKVIHHPSPRGQRRQAQRVKRAKSLWGTPR